MATTATQPKAQKDVKVYTFVWEGKDKSGKIVKGEMRASGENIVNATLRRQGIVARKSRRYPAGAARKSRNKILPFLPDNWQR